MRPQIVKILTYVYCFLTAIPMLSQGPSPGAGPPSPNRCPGCPPEDPLPIDDHIWIIILVGLLFGIYVVVKKHRLTNTHS